MKPAKETDRILSNNGIRVNVMSEATLNPEEKSLDSQEIEDLSWKYLRMYPVRDFVWENFKKILTSMAYEDSQAFQNQLFHKTLKHPIAQQYPPAGTYTQLFLKSLINQVESCNQEVSDDLLSTYTRMLSEKSNQHCDFSYRTYKQNSGSITLKETGKLICNGTTGMCTWEAGHFLAEWCSKNACIFQNKNVIELGCGLGLTGLSVLKNCNPSIYVFTDVNSSVLNVLNENIRINFPSNSYNDDEHKNYDSPQFSYEPLIQVRVLDWECDTYDNGAPVNIILAADVVYDPDVITHFIRTLKDIMCRYINVTAYVASAVRNRDTYSFFRNELASKGLTVTLEVQEEFQDAPSQSQVSVSLLEMKLEKDV